MNQARQHRAAEQLPSNDACLSALISAVARNEPTSLAQLRSAAEGLLFSVACRRLRNRSDAEEVVAEVLLRVWLHAGTFDASKGTGGAWLTRLCANAAIDRLRQAAARDPDRIRGHGEESAQPDSPEWLTERHQLTSAVERAMTKLSNPHRAVLEMVYYRDMSHREVSALAQIPLGTVKCWLRRSLGRLRLDLQTGDPQSQVRSRQQTAAGRVRPRAES